MSLRVAAVGAGYFSQFHYHGLEEHRERRARVALADQHLPKGCEMA
jgi:predicted dehydrogenase